MRVLWLLIFVNSALAQAGFGTPYLSKSRLCHQWTCVNTKLGLPESLPPKEQATAVLSSILPEGAWRNLTDIILDVCYENRTRRYTNTCPGQGLLHCVMDQMIENCPEESLRKDDVCSPVTSLSGVKYMFSQSMYEDLKNNLVNEIRPEWFFRNYFKSKCCRVPPIINLSTQMQCGFTSILSVFTHSPRYAHDKHPQKLPAPFKLNPKTDGDHVNIVNFEDPEADVDIQNLDPLDCCDISEFIQPSWRIQCDFHMKWNSTNRLSIDISQGISTTTAPVTTSKPKQKDFMVVPQNCDKTSCVFKKLNIVSGDGVVDVKGFIKLLDNITEEYPLWNSAKARVITTCLRKSLLAYEGECELNKILACTFDVLSEQTNYVDIDALSDGHDIWDRYSRYYWFIMTGLDIYDRLLNCPLIKKNSSCKRGSRKDGECQISSSKYRPKHRRDPCAMLPELVTDNFLTQCNVSTLSRIEFAPETPVRINKSGLDLFKFQCKGQSLSTTCLLDKMAVLNKYTFMDYFKMKAKIRTFTATQPLWTPYTDGYLSAFSTMPMYQDHCSSPKKLLNVVDAMLMTCPLSKRQNTQQCKKMFKEVSKAIPANMNFSETVVNHFNRIFLPNYSTQRPNIRKIKHYNKHKQNPLYYALLNTDSAPQVAVIDVPKTYKQPLIIKPVYLKPKVQNPILTPYGGDKVFRSSPFWLHEQIAAAHVTAPSVARNDSVSTKPAVSTFGSFQLVTP